MALYVIVLVSMILRFYKQQNLDLAIAQVQLKEQIELVQKEKLQKENLLGILAHDVKTPVSNLGQLFELYQDDLLTEQELKELMKGMQSRIGDLQGTIDGILGQLKTEIIKEKSKEVLGNPILITQKVIKNLDYKFESKSQRINFNHPEINDITLGKYNNEISIRK